METTITHSLRRALTAALFLPAVSLAQPAELAEPLVSRNLDPVLGNLGVPVMADARGLAAGEWQGGWGLHWASHSHRESSAGLVREYDGETLRQDLFLAVGIGRAMTLSLNLPWISHRGGSLDPLIEGWHDLWGMPNGIRDSQADDQIRFALDGDAGFLLDDEVSGLGDIELGLAVDLWSSTQGAAVSGFAQLKFSTGDAADFTGSGETALALGLRASSPHCIWESLSCHGQFGIVDVGDLEQGPEPSDTVLFGGLSLAWSASSQVAVIAQLEVQEQPYGAGPLDAVGTPVLGTLGLRWIPASRWRLEAQFSEDLNVGSAPDVTFRIAASRRW